MPLLRKFACGCFIVGALTALGMVILQVPEAGNRFHAQSSSSIAGNALIQLASSQADSVYHEASSEIVPNLKSLGASSSALVHSSAITARLQFEGMANSLPSLFAVNSWLPRGAPYWTQSGLEGAVQVSSGQATT